MEIKDKLKELGFKDGRVFSTKKVEGYVFVINQTNEIFFVSEEYKKIMKELSEDFKVTSNDKRHLPDTLTLFINSARDDVERKLFKEIAGKIRVLDKHSNIASVKFKED